MGAGVDSRGLTVSARQSTVLQQFDPEYASAGVCKLNPAQELSHGQPRPAGPRGKEAEEIEGPKGACEITVRAHTSQTNANGSREHTARLKGTERARGAFM